MRGGSRGTDGNELAGMPWTRPGTRSTVTTVTPVANCPSAKRNSEDVVRVEFIAEVFEDTIVHCVRRDEIDGAENCDFGRDRAGRIGFGEPVCASGRAYRDWFARCGARSACGEAIAREDWRDSADR